jgi:hypothetical protein
LHRLKDLLKTVIFYEFKPAVNVIKNFVMANLRYGSGDADAEDILHAVGERERALKCGCLPRNAGDLTGLALTCNKQSLAEKS